ncbi:glycosyl hydrolase family 28 protein [Actinoplanes missouriensis]|uniref:glycosyl hydrolase family 28 protein n=1 Tax=Actinoplanes missouriensis TaxID=1866 RepID=UPI0033D69148
MRKIPVLLMFVLASLLVATPAQAAPAAVDVYPVPSIYPTSPDYTLTVNGTPVPVQDYPGYDIAQFALGDGEATIAITKVNNTNIGAYRISPRKLGIAGTVSGPTLTFTVRDDAYLIVKIDGRPDLVIAADPAETNRPASSGAGVFPVGPAPSTASFQQTLNDAAAWGSANSRQGIVYVPAGVYPVGNLYLRSDLALYLAPGAVLRFTGNRSENDVHWRKESQQRDITWFISTRYSSKNISIYGRGIIDGNGKAALAPGNLGVNLLTPIYTTNFAVDGITFRESSSWAIMPTRSSDMTFRNLKIFNRFDMGENDGIDVMESTNVTVRHAIGVGLDDPFSTKTWDTTVDLFAKVPGEPRPQSNILFDDLVTFTYCYGVKVGQGVFQTQEDITFRNVTVYDAAVALGVHHKYGAAPARRIRFENIDVEKLSFSNDSNRTWLALWTGETHGVGPIQDVVVSNARLHTLGTTPARVNGKPAAPVTGVVLRQVYAGAATTPATTLAELNLTNISDSGPITVTG